MGEEVVVRRSNGDIESGWRFSGVDSEGCAIVQRMDGGERLTKHIPTEELLELNPHTSNKENDGERALQQLYDAIYEDSDMRLAFEYIENAIFPGGRRYERGSSASTATFGTVMERLRTEADLLKVVRQITADDNNLIKELDDPNVLEQRKIAIRDQLAFNKQRNLGIQKVRERLFG